MLNYITIYGRQVAPGQASIPLCKRGKH